MVSFNSRFTKSVLGSSGGLKFVILVKGFDSGGPSSVTVRTTSEGLGGRKHYLVVFFYLGVIVGG